MENYYFCFGCGNNKDIVKFSIKQVEKNGVYILDCLDCKFQTACVQCKSCQELKYCKYGDINTIIQCVCGSKQRIYECTFCKCPQIINCENLKQNSKLICFSCRNAFYIINCPGCQNMKILNTINNINYCENCNLNFQIDECKFCQEDAFSKDKFEPFIFKCSNNHQYQKLICLQCKTPNKLNVSNNKNYICQKCNTKMKHIQCLCGQNQIIRRSENDQLGKFKCQGCQLDFQIRKCNTLNCLGVLLKLDKPTIKPSEFGPFIEIVNTICFSCKQQKYLSQCLRCYAQQEPYNINKDKPNKCLGCQQEFTDSKYRECVICFNHIADSIILPCKHVCLCHLCLQNFKETCPLCRRIIQDKFRIFLN